MNVNRKIKPVKFAIVNEHTENNFGNKDYIFKVNCVEYVRFNVTKINYIVNKSI